LCGRAGECFDPAIKGGRCGDWVWYVWKGHQWRRRWLKGLDPKTARQRVWRAHLAAASKSYGEVLTEEQRAACIAAGASRRSRPRLAQSGLLTGQQYWVGKECKENPPVPAPRARKRKP
jgi:hypothetical protein